MPNTYFLIVDQFAKAPQTLPALCKELATRFQLDIYQCRQRLLGRGLSLLAKGPQEQLSAVADLLRQHRINHWLIQPKQPAFAPRRIKALSHSGEAISFTCQQEQVTFPVGANIVAIFADLSGKLAEKNVQQLLASHAYQGKEHIHHIDDEKLFRSIMQGRPVLDLYLLNNSGQVENAVRILPGKFDPKGLADKVTLSSRQNLKAILGMARDYAGTFALYTDLGLVNLPGCQIQQDDTNNPETVRRNLLSLTRYGWLMTAITAEQQQRAIPAAANPAASLLTNAAIMNNPELAIAGSLAEIGAVSAEVSADGDARAENATTTAQPETLPPPPASPQRKSWQTPQFWLGALTSVVIGLIMAALHLDRSGHVRNLMQSSFTTGFPLLLLAVILFWYGFYFVRMKREIENTPTSRVRSVAMGMVEVKGRALRKYALISPMTHTACSYYRLTRYRRDKDNHWKVSSVRNSANVPFYLEDNTGRIEIDPDRCRVHAATRQEGEPGQTGLFHVASDSREKWVEEIVVEGSLLYVLGYARVKRPEGPTMAERRIAALRELKQNRHKLAAYDIDGDGQISQEEWEKARQDAENLALQESLATRQQRKKQEEHIVIGKHKGHPMIISEIHSEDALTARYLYYSIPLFLASAVATGFAIYCFITYLK